MFEQNWKYTWANGYYTPEKETAEKTYLPDLISKTLSSGTQTKGTGGGVFVPAGS